jgi:hypothetical protein
LVLVSGLDLGSPHPMTMTINHTGCPDHLP